MMRIVGFYKGTFVCGDYVFQDAADKRALKTLLADFRGAVCHVERHNAVSYAHLTRANGYEPPLVLVQGGK